MPPSPCMGSTRMAHVSASSSLAAASRSPKGAWLKRARSGTTPAADFGWAVAMPAASARRWAVAEQIAAPAGEEVEVAIAFGVPHLRPLAAHQADGVAGVVADDVFFELLDGLLRSHGPWSKGTNAWPRKRLPDPCRLVRR